MSKLPSRSPVATFVWSIVVAVILVAIGIGIAQNNGPNEVLEIQFGFGFLTNLLGAVLATLGGGCLLLSLSSKHLVTTFGRSIVILFVGLAISSSSSVFVVCSVLVYVADSVLLFLQNRQATGE